MSLDLHALLAARRPGWSLPQPFYTSPEIHALDLARIYRREWLYAGPECRIPKPGDFFTFELGPDSLIVMRGEDGRVRAHFNVCRHRGSRICLEHSGHARKLVCPYHQWIYNPDGSLHEARNMGAGFDPAGFALRQSHARTVAGLIFVNFSEAPADFDAFARDVAAYLEPHEFASARIAHAQTYQVQSNWKLLVENSRECYHCPVGHPEYTQIMYGKNPEDAAARMNTYNACGLPTRRVVGPSYHVSRYPTARREYPSQSLDGRQIAPLMGCIKDPDAGVLGLVSFPNLMFLACGDHAVSFRFNAVDAMRTDVEALWLVRGDAVEGRDYSKEHLLGFWKATGEEDWILCENNQAGVNSSRYEPGPYGEEESDLQRFVDWYLQEIQRPEPAPRCQSHPSAAAAGA